MRLSFFSWTLFSLLLIAMEVVSPPVAWASDVSGSTRSAQGTELGFPQASSPLYGELHFGAGGVRHSDLDFFPLFASFTAGFFVVPNIGLEVFADAALADEDNAGFDMELSSAFGVALRLQSPPRAGLSGYVVVGMVDYTLTQTPRGSSADNRAIEEDFRGARVSVGVMQQLRRVPALSVSAEYRSYYADQPIKVDSIVFGLRVSP